MNYSIFRFTLNMHSHRSQASVSAFHGDTAVRLLFALTDGGVPYKIEGGCVAILTGTKADGTKLVHRCTILNDMTTIQYDFEEQTSSCVGVVSCEIALYGADGKTICAPKFTIVIDERETTDLNLSTDDENLLASIALAEVQRVEAEAERKKAEVERRNLWIAYSANPNGSNYTWAWSEGQNYIGFAVSHDAPSTEQDFVWALFKGAPGDKGDKGEKGDKGDTGAQGIQGEKGDKGDQGNQGTQGEKGDKGDKGDQGEQGKQGEKGDKGDPFSIAKMYKSIAEMNGDFGNANVRSGSFVMIDTGNPADEDNGKVYVKGTTSFNFIVDMSGVTGLKGEKGDKGDQGEQGKQGEKGDPGTSISISKISESDADGGSNVVTFSNGNTLTIKNGSKGSDGANGINGKDGANGKTPYIQNGYWYIDGTNTNVKAQGSDGINGKNGQDYVLTEADKNDIASLTAILLRENGVIGAVDANNNIIVSGNLADGTYTLKYENADGTTTEIGTITVGDEVIVYEVDIASVGYTDNARWSTSGGDIRTGANGNTAINLVTFERASGQEMTIHLSGITWSGGATTTAILFFTNGTYGGSSHYIPLDTEHNYNDVLGGKTVFNTDGSIDVILTDHPSGTLYNGFKVCGVGSGASAKITITIK